MPAALSQFAPRLAPRLGPILASLLLGVVPLAPPAQAAQELVVRLDGLTLPLDIDQLAAWARNPAHPKGDLAVWFDLLDPGSRKDLLRLLRAPLVQDRSLGRQLIESWAGEQVLGAMGDVISGAGMAAAWQPRAGGGDPRPPGPPTDLAASGSRPVQGVSFPGVPNAAPPGPLPPLPASPGQRSQAPAPLAPTEFGQTELRSTELLPTELGPKDIAPTGLGPTDLSPELQAGGPLLVTSLRQLLQHQQTVTTIDLLQAVPTRRITLNLDALVAMASQWRRQLEAQRQALAVLRRLPLPERGPLLTITDGLAIASAPSGLVDQARSPGSNLAAGRGPSPIPTLTPPGRDPPIRSQLVSLPVAHRSSPLKLVLWPAQPSAPNRGWVLLMPGLGGSAAQLGWLGAALAERGWPVLVLEHPGSDEQAMRALLDGLQPPPGAETVAIRLLDVQAVVAAEQAGRLPSLGPSVVLMGHSFGGLTALLAAGLRPEADLAGRCRRALRQLPLTNVSRLLQCQLARVTLPTPQPLAQPVAGLVIFNGFGSLLWPNRGLAGLAAPVLLLGGSLDLVTPPLREQLELFLPEANPRNRLALVDGASHFSPVRIRPGSQALFQLGEELVGLAPERVQGMELSLTSEFLLGLNSPMALPPQRRKLGGVNAYVLDRAAAVRWRAALKT